MKNTNQTIPKKVKNSHKKKFIFEKKAQQLFTFYIEASKMHVH